MTSRDAVTIRHVAFEDLGVLEPLLAQRGFRVTYLDAGIDTLSPAAAADLLIVLGGPIGVYDTDAYPFLSAEIDAVAARLADRRPTLGVCLGAQLMARALRADVRATGRHEIGYAPIDLTAEGGRSVLAPVAGVPVLHWHGDEFAIPDGALRLAGTSGFPNQAFALGDWALGLQFHLEADPSRIERWLVGHAHELASCGIDPRTIRADAREHGATLADAAREIFGTWLDRALA
ncbi:glutamine amidotransferase [Propionicicella superfundia]|uniref:glutamine amidotransferase n=1 Tax=Propionicicella superfundia TaxID=348582 RepID=UPI000416CDA5|nr:glutamine amidotransferase [Propionicicella superfundia]